MIIDSGERREFNTGAVRDIGENKGRTDLLPLYEVGILLNDSTIKYIAEFIKTGDERFLYYALEQFGKDAFSDIRTAMLELSIHFEQGAAKYSERNWEKGIPCHCYIDSAVRHYLKYLRDDKDERHDRAFLWNILCLLWTLHNKPELNDLPFNNSKN